MKVKKLMEYLECVDPEANVVLRKKDGEELLIADFVGLSMAPEHMPFPSPFDYCSSVVVLKGISDIDLKKELEVFSRYALYIGLEEDEFYRDILEAGITVDMVRKYVGDERADTMKAFCEEHGLM